MLRNCFLALMLLTCAVAPSQKQTTPSEAKKITGSGCVEPGVETKCFMVKDIKTNELYNVIFAAGKEAELGTAIRFEGTPHDGPTTCMQGKAVKVTKWTPVKMQCEKPKQGEPPK